MLLSNMDMVLAKSSIAIASRYAELVPDVALRERIFGRIRREYDLVIATLLEITEPQSRVGRQSAAGALGAPPSPISTRSTTCRSNC